MSKKLLSVGVSKATLIVLYLLIVQGSRSAADNKVSLKNGQTNLISSVILSGDTINLQQSSDTIFIARKKFDFIEINYYFCFITCRSFNSDWFVSLKNHVVSYRTRYFNL